MMSYLIWRKSLNVHANSSFIRVLVCSLTTAESRAKVCKIYLSPPRPSLLSILICDSVVVHSLLFIAPICCWVFVLGSCLVRGSWCPF